jgi:hypothetical protein
MCTTATGADATDGFASNEHSLPIVPLFKEVMGLMPRSDISLYHSFRRAVNRFNVHIIINLAFRRASQALQFVADAAGCRLAGKRQLR